MIKGIETGAATFCHSLRMDFTGLTPAVMGYLRDLYRLYRAEFLRIRFITQNPDRAVGASSGDYENENTSEHG